MDATTMYQLSSSTGPEIPSFPQRTQESEEVFHQVVPEIDDQRQRSAQVQHDVKGQPGIAETQEPRTRIRCADELIGRNSPRP